MKIIERLRNLIVFKYLTVVKLKRDEIEALLGEVEVMENQLYSNKVRVKTVNDANQRLAESREKYINILHKIPGYTGSSDKINYAAIWILNAQIIMREHNENVSTLLATQQELKNVEKLLDIRSQIVKAIPQCPEHGDCLPYALSWIESSSAIREGYNNLTEAVHRLTNENAELKGQLFVMRGALREAHSKAEQELSFHDGWKPINSAPKDGSIFEIKNIDGTVSKAKIEKRDFNYFVLLIFSGAGWYQTFARSEPVELWRPYVEKTS